VEQNGTLSFQNGTTDRSTAWNSQSKLTQRGVQAVAHWVKKHLTYADILSELKEDSLLGICHEIGEI
jgi:hypothetical protein